MNLNKIPLFAMLSKRMSWLNQRQQTLAGNIANADTPGYKPEDLAPVNFERMVANENRGISMTATDARHLASGSRGFKDFRVNKQDDADEMTPSGNAVVLEEQLMKVSKTVLDHRITAGLYTKHLGMIRTVLGRS